MDQELILILRKIQKDLHTIAEALQVKKMSPEETARAVLKEFGKDSPNLLK